MEQQKTKSKDKMTCKHPSESLFADHTGLYCSNCGQEVLNRPEEYQRLLDIYFKTCLA